MPAKPPEDAPTPDKKPTKKAGEDKVKKLKKVHKGMLVSLDLGKPDGEKVVSVEPAIGLEFEGHEGVGEIDGDASIPKGVKNEGESGDAEDDDAPEEKDGDSSSTSVYFSGNKKFRDGYANIFGKKPKRYEC